MTFADIERRLNSLPPRFSYFQRTHGVPRGPEAF